MIPTHNRLSYLKESVESVLQQSYSKWELVIVDDASTDGTPHWLATIGDPRINTFSADERRERGRSMNFGAEQASNDLLLFLDDDDRLRPQALHHLVRSLGSTTPDHVAAIGGMCFFDNDGHRRRMPHPILRRSGSLWPAVLAGWNVGRGQVLMTRSAFESAGRWNETSIISDDIEALLRVTRKGPTVVSPHIVFEKRAHASNTKIDQLRMRDMEMREAFVARLEGPDRDLGERALRLMETSLRAHDRYHSNNDYRGALSAYIAAIRMRSSVSDSLLLPPGLFLGSGKAALGLLPGTDRALTGLRRANRALRGRLSRYPRISSEDAPITEDDRPIT